MSLIPRLLNKNCALAALAVGALAALAPLALAAPTALDDGLAAANRGDFAAAFQIWRSLAEQGDPAAQFNLGLLYENGQGVAQDDVLAFRWFFAAAEAGDVEAQDEVGLMYEVGRGVLQDDDRALAWRLKAASRGLAAAQTHLGELYERGAGRLPDMVEAYAWYDVAASHNPSASEDEREAAAQDRDALAWKMTASQIEQARRRARELAASAAADREFTGR